ncbi:redox-regulated ATPase YchF [Candidatus Woesearchaeota archaeon]|nr:redox-regulated ATPase YchF [Candidatus Woesearchaeota archaeon]
MIIGVVGKANVGKSTFFKASTLADVEIANYPFATIKPNSGIGFVKIDCADSFFSKQCNPRVGYCINHKRFVPVNMIDVAGLVPGAHEGKGMGLEFLNDLNQADLLIHVIDVSGSTNEKGEPVPPGSRDPAEDVLFLEKELDYWYLSILKKVWDKFSRSVTQTNQEIDKALNKQFSGLGSDEEMIKSIIVDTNLADKKLRFWSEDDLLLFASELRKKTKPMIVAANKIDVKGALNNFESLKKRFPDTLFVPCSAESELALKEAAKHKLINYVPGNKEFEIIGSLSDKQKKALDFIKDNVLIHGTGVQDALNKAVFDVLEYIPIFPGGVNKLEDQHGNVLPDCFLLKKGSTALDFAFKIHSDFGKNFIRAIDVKTKRTVGKEHVLSFGDVVEIISHK